MHRVISGASQAGACAWDMIPCLLWGAPATLERAQPQQSRPAQTCSIPLSSVAALSAPQQSPLGGGLRLPWGQAERTRGHLSPGIILFPGQAAQPGFSLRSVRRLLAGIPTVLPCQ